MQIGTTAWGGLDRMYDDDLRRRQADHLRDVQRRNRGRPSDCAHNHCSECVGTGIKKDGTACVHHISCPCPRCTPGI